MTALTILLSIVVAVLALLAIIAALPTPILPKYELIDYDDKWLTVRRIAGTSDTVEKFYGSCTVWHFPDGTRCSTMLESRLSELWTLSKIRQEQNPRTQ